ncbi:hypothetical protein [Brucella anthropi]|uniref:hypothetical protein n=1 Tax=Brucella anthropi TaxID=529 RepID=UPI001CFCE1E9|nr:hypothetical protein [Brucella anthropi]
MKTPWRYQTAALVGIVLGILNAIARLGAAAAFSNTPYLFGSVVGGVFLSLIVTWVRNRFAA